MEKTLVYYVMETPSYNYISSTVMNPIEHPQMSQSIHLSIDANNASKHQKDTKRRSKRIVIKANQIM